MSEHGMSEHEMKTQPLENLRYAGLQLGLACQAKSEPMNLSYAYLKAGICR